MAEDKKLSASLINLAYYSFFALIFITPLIFSKWVENSFDLVKKSSLIFFGGLFIMFTIFYIFASRYDKDPITKPTFDKRFDLLIIFFLIAASVSTIFSIKPYVSYYGQYERQIGLITYIYVVAVYFFSARIFSENNKIDSTLKIMETSALLVGIYAMLQYLGIDPFDAPLIAETRPISTMAHSIFAGGFLSIMLPFALIRIFTSKKPILPVIYSVIIAWGILLTQSRAAYIAAIAGIIIILVLYPYVYKNNSPDRYKKIFRYNLIILAFFAALIIISFIFLPNNPYTERLAQVMDLPKTARWLLWRDSLNAFLSYPVTGSGIATFSNIFEYAISYELKLIDPSNYYDHAHNVYIHTLCTMGILGLVSYLLFFIYGIFAAVKGFFTSHINKAERLYFLAIFSSLTAYSIYSLADFEDTTILLYLFVIFAVLKTLYNKNFNIGFTFNTENENLKRSFRLIFNVIFAAIIIYCNYNIYFSYNELKADEYYRDGKNKYIQGDVKGSIQSFNNAVITNFGSAEYKYTLASYVQDYCLKNPGISPDSKNNLLTQAAQELERAKINLFSHLQYKALLTMIQFQMGNKETAERMRSEIFQKDSLILNFRNSLARYYFSVNDYEKMRAELKVIFWFDPFNVDAAITSATYYMVVKDKERALMVCENILEKDPNNQLILQLKELIKNAP